MSLQDDITKLKYEIGKYINFGKYTVCLDGYFSVEELSKIIEMLKRIAEEE